MDKAPTIEKRRVTLMSKMAQFDFRRLSYLQAAVRSGSIRSGADALGTSPSALSRQIAKMEAELDVILIERHGRGVRPTAVGSLFIEMFDQQKSQLERMVQDVTEILTLKKGVVTLALGQGFVDDVMSSALKAFSAQHPDIRFDFLLGTTNEIVRKVEEDEADIGLAYNVSPSTKIHSHQSAPHPLSVLTNPDHPLTKIERPLTLADLVGYDLGLSAGNVGIRQALNLAEGSFQSVLSPKIISGSTNMLVSFVQIWGGVSIGPSFIVKREIENKTIVALPISDEKLQNVKVHLFTRRGRQLMPAAMQLLQTLRSSLSVLRDEGTA